jgi:transcriptional regulator with XRE-family HTH domain
MSKRSEAIDAMPSAVLAHLRELGENLSIARKRRRESRKAWAQRMGVSEPTLARMEKGDPSVSMGVYATALWLMGRAQALAALAAPEHDRGALEDAVRAAQTRAVRTRRPVISNDPTTGQT